MRATALGLSGLAAPALLQARLQRTGTLCSRVCICPVLPDLTARLLVLDGCATSSRKLVLRLHNTQRFPSSPPHPPYCCGMYKIDRLARRSYIQRLHAKIRFEGLGLPTLPADGQGIERSSLLPLVAYNCTGLSPNASDLTMNVRGWQPQQRQRQGPTVTCGVMDGGAVAMYVLKTRTGPSAADLIPLELWYKPGDHYLVASSEGKRKTHLLCSSSSWLYDLT